MTRASRAAAIASGICLVLNASAFAQKVNIDFDEKVDFSTFKTFMIRQGTMQSPVPALNNELTQKHLERAIEHELTARGLTKGDGASADLNVFYTLGSRGATERQESPGGPFGRGTRVERVPVTEGNLVIALRDPKTRSLVWRGIASDEKANPADIAKKLDDWVRKVVEKYPPKKK
jgi:Domain of unknown function (DUF4136)